jgi:hypothetical protein
MASWILVPCLVTLRDEFNRLAPNRDKASDGSIGDTAHAYSSSDHNPDETGTTPYEDADRRNEVHAIDVDDDLRKAGWTMNRCLQIIIGRHRQGRDDRLQNVIYNRRIWSRSWGWTARAYTGASTHTEHAHFSARYTTAQENDTSPWGLVQQEVEDVGFADDKIRVTGTTGRELFDPDLKAGAEVDAATVLQLAAIWARRGARDAADIEARLSAIEADIAAIKAAVLPASSAPESSTPAT